MFDLRAAVYFFTETTVGIIVLVILVFYTVAIILLVRDLYAIRKQLDNVLGYLIERDGKPGR